MDDRRATHSRSYLFTIVGGMALMVLLVIIALVRVQHARTHPKPPSTSDMQQAIIQQCPYMGGGWNLAPPYDSRDFDAHRSLYVFEFPVAGDPTTIYGDAQPLHFSVTVTDNRISDVECDPNLIGP